MLFASTVKGWVLIILLLESYVVNYSNMFVHWYSWKCDGVKPFKYGHLKGAIESVRINGMSRLNSFNLEGAFFPQGQSKVSVIIRFLY